MSRRLLVVLLFAAGASMAQAQDACPPNAAPYDTTTDGDTTTVHCQCDPGYIIGDDGCILAPTPALPTLADSTQTVGSALDATGTPYLPNADSTLNRTRAVLSEFLLGKLKSSALSGSILGVEVSSPMGHFIAIEVNVKQSIPWVTSQIGAAASGNLTAEQAGNLPFELANRIFDVGSPANAVMSNGVVGAGMDAAQGQVTASVTGGVASLASSFLPATDEVKESIAASAPGLAGNLQSLVHAWTKSGAEGEP